MQTRLAQRGKKRKNYGTHLNFPFTCFNLVHLQFSIEPLFVLVFFLGISIYNLQKRMSRFVDEDEADVQTARDFAGVIGERDAVELAKELAEDDAEANEHEVEKKRRSLHQQLAAYRYNRYKEHKKKMETQNSSYKMRKDTRQFYGKLEAEKAAKKQQETQEFASELERFRRAKERAADDDSLSTSSSDSEAGGLHEKEKNNKKEDGLNRGVNAIVEYSDSDNSSDNSTQ